MKKTLLFSAFAFALSCQSMGAAAQNTAQFSPIDYDTIIGENGGQFIDVGSDEFVLAEEEWVDIQVYAHQAVGLPITETAMRNAFLLPANQDFMQFEALLEQYKEVHKSGDTWNRELYPEVVDLSLRLSNYSDIHIAFLEPLLEVLDQIRELSNERRDRSCDRACRQQLREEIEDLRIAAIDLLKTLRDFSLEQQAAVQKVEDDLINFTADVVGQQSQLQSIEELYREFINNDDRNTLQLEIDNLKKDVERLNRQIDKAHRDIGYAAATANPIVITVVGAIRGTEIKNLRRRRRGLLREVAEVQQELNTKISLQLSYERAEESVGMMEDAITKALPHLQTLKSHWQAMSADFDTIIDQIDVANSRRGLRNIVAFSGAILADISINRVDERWREISDKALSFSQNAYITVD